MCLGIILLLHTAERAVVPRSLVKRIKTYGVVVVGNGKVVLVLSYMAQASKLVHIVYIRV